MIFMDDEESSQKPLHYVTGFGSLADLISSDIDHSAAIFKRFDKLAARDLLYYQSELAELQAKQDQFDREDAIAVNDHNANDLQDIRENNRDWTAFEKTAMDDSTRNHESWKARMELAKEIRIKLKEYREALVLNSTLLALHPPCKQSMTAISKAFHRSGYDTLTGASRHLYPHLSENIRPQDNDYVSLSPHDSPDLLTYLLKTHFSWAFRYRKARSHGPAQTLSHIPSPQMTQFSIERVNTATLLVDTLLAVALLFIPIYSLYHVSKSQPNTTMGLIGMFTLIFACSVAVVTNARRGEIFAATAAYAAVLVVFVSGNFAQQGGVSS